MELTRSTASCAALRRTCASVLLVLILALTIGVLAAKLLFTLTDIRTDGMAGTLNTGDVALCVRCDAPILGRQAERGSLALLRHTEAGMHRQTVRRVIALAGDVISVDDDGRVTLNGLPLEEPYATYRRRDDWTGDEVIPGGALENPFSDEQPRAPAQTQAEAGVDDREYPLTVPQGEVFVLCDNRDNLLDSRSSRFGRVSETDIQGLAQAILWPVFRAGTPGGGTAVK